MKQSKTEPDVRAAQKEAYAVDVMHHGIRQSHLTEPAIPMLWLGQLGNSGS